MKAFHFRPLNLPPAELRIRQADDHYEVYDPSRAKWLYLTDEEWVRQNFVGYLVSELGYPRSVIGNEVSLTLNRTRRRADSIVFGPDGKPAMIIEYKAPDVPITQQVFEQIVRYNLTLNGRVLAVSNGLTHYCCLIDPATSTYRFLDALPPYPTLLSLL